MAWKPIIVGVDHSPESLRAAEVATAIAHAAGASLIPVHAVPVAPVFTDLVGLELPRPTFSPELQNDLNRLSRGQLVRELEPILPASALRRLEVQTGPGAFVIAELARKWRAELVVLGGKQHGALARGLGRSTAHYLVRTLDIPVLVVGDSTKPVARVLAAVDLSTASRPTIETAERFAKLFGARVRLIHVVEPLRFTQLLPDQWDAVAYDRGSREMFDRFTSRFQEIAQADRVVRTGLPAEAIATEVGDWRADVLVVGSHGKGWVDRILVGSTTQRLVTELPTSILVVPAKAARRVRAVAKAPRGTRRHGSTRPAKARR